MPSRGLLAVLTGAMLSTLSCAVLSPPRAPAPLPAAAAVADAAEAETIGIIRAALSARSKGMTHAEIGELARVVVQESRRRQLDPALVMAVMHVESRFNAYAVSPVGAMGLMQILPSTGEELAAKHGVAWYGPQTLFDPVVNLRLGVAYLRELSSRYGNVTIALAAYNWGPGRIDRRLRRGRQLPTDYPRLVLEAHAAAQDGGRRS
jgi:soluble lytic murein transglycosylase-like protein